MADIHENLTHLLPAFSEIYEANFDTYTRCGADVAEDIAYLLAEHQIKHIPITNRVKEWESIERTAQRRQNDRLKAEKVQAMLGARWAEYCERYKVDPLAVGHFPNVAAVRSAIHDVVGVRVALYFPSDAKEVVKVLRKAFYTNVTPPKRMGGLDDTKRLRKLEDKWHADRQRGVGGPAGNDTDGIDDDLGKQFSGYGALHWVVRVPQRLHQSMEWNDLVVEIQIGTVIMHAWSEVEHDIIYKRDRGIPTEAEERTLDVMNGLALAGEVALRGLVSPASAAPVPMPANTKRFQAPGKITDRLRRFYARHNQRTPAAWAGVQPLFEIMAMNRRNTYDELERLIISAWGVVRDFRASVELDYGLPVFMLDEFISTLPDYYPLSRVARGEGSEARELAMQFTSACHLASVFGCSSTLRAYFQYKLKSCRGAYLSVIDILDLLHPQQPRCASDRVAPTINMLHALLDEQLDMDTIVFQGVLLQKGNGDDDESLDDLYDTAYARILLSQSVIRLAKKGYAVWPVFKGPSPNNAATATRVLVVPGNMFNDRTLAEFCADQKRDTYVAATSSETLELEMGLRLCSRGMQGGFFRERAIFRPSIQEGPQTRSPKWKVLCEGCHIRRWKVGHVSELVGRGGAPLGMVKTFKYKFGMDELSRWYDKVIFGKGGQAPKPGFGSAEHKKHAGEEPRFSEAVDGQDKDAYFELAEIEQAIFDKLRAGIPLRVVG